MSIHPVIATMLLPLLLDFSITLALKAKPKFRHEQEWNKWKFVHDRNYTNELEELERHLIWLSNKVYIDLHNANAHIFGFNLAMNHLGDLVCLKERVFKLPVSLSLQKYLFCFCRVKLIIWRN